MPPVSSLSHAAALASSHWDWEERKRRVGRERMDNRREREEHGRGRSGKKRKGKENRVKKEKRLCVLEIIIHKLYCLN
jgi:hypothetical protein